MLKRLRELRISLAAKCQILFGAAVVLIIAAALLVPWQRMEQLTGQLHEQAAAGLGDDALARHVAAHSPPAPDEPVADPDPGPDPESAPPTRPATAPTTGP